MNDLNAQQIVLLTLLVSFVTSIATGITTVSLLEQAPEPVNQTINRIVEKTIERVVPDEIDNNQNIVKTPEKEIVTVVVNQEDLTVEAVQKNSKSLVRIYVKEGRERVYNSLGIVVNSKGIILVDASRISNYGKYVFDYDGIQYDVDVLFKDSHSPYALLVPKDVLPEVSFQSAKFANSQNLKLAQTVINLSGSNSNTVSTGIITSLFTEQGAIQTDQEKTEQEINLISTSINSQNILNGSTLLNLQGEVVGARMGFGLNAITDFKPANSLKAFLTSQAL